MNCEEFGIHLMECLEDGREPATTSEARAHLESCGDCRPQAAELVSLWQRLPMLDPGHSTGEVSSSAMTARFDEALETLLEAQQLSGSPKPTRSAGRVLEGPWTRPVVSAIAATLALGVALGLFFGGRISTSDEVRALRAEMRSVNETVAVALMKHDSASERLRGIALSSDNLSGVTSGDARVIDALFERVRSDPNDNVRVAAVEALAAAVDRAEVRDGLAACIGYQESPQVQAAVLETLALSDRSTVDAALSSEELDDDVRQWFLAVSPSFVG